MKSQGKIPNTSESAVPKSVIAGFGDRIKQRRRLFGIHSQDHLAKLVGVSQSAVSGWENEHAEPGFEALAKLSELLQCSIHWLVTGQEYPRVGWLPLVASGRPVEIPEGPYTVVEERPGEWRVSVKRPI